MRQDIYRLKIDFNKMEIANRGTLRTTQMFNAMIMHLKKDQVGVFYFRTHQMAKASMENFIDYVREIFDDKVLCFRNSLTVRIGCREFVFRSFDNREEKAKNYSKQMKDHTVIENEIIEILNKELNTK